MEDELFEDKNKPYKKRKLHDLLDKYGTIEELEQHGSVEDNFDYMFAGQRELLDEVLEERRENTGLKAENENYDEAENLTEKRQKTAVNLQKKLLEDDEQEKQKSGAHDTLPATSRSSLDDEDMAKNAAKHPMYQTPSDREVESLRARSLADRVKENQSAENDRTETKSERGKVFTDDNAFIKLMGHHLIKTEGIRDFIYLDKNGHITVGVGNMLDDEEKFKSMHWKIDGRDATHGEISEAYNIFKSLQQEKDYDGKFKYRNYKADYFKKFSKLRISEDTMIEAMQEHIAKDLQRVRQKNINFDSLPQPMKLIIMDFYYNKGSFFNQKNLPQALKNRHKKSFKRAMIRGMSDRDAWTLEQFEQIPESFWK